MSFESEAKVNMLFKNVSLYKMKSFKVVRLTGKGGGKYGMGRRRKRPKESFNDTNCGIVLIIKLS